MAYLLIYNNFSGIFSSLEERMHQDYRDHQDCQDLLSAAHKLADRALLLVLAGLVGIPVLFVLSYAFLFLLSRLP